MRKSIFPALLCCDLVVMAAHAAINPIPLLTEQCLNLSLSSEEANRHDSVEARALSIEHELLGLHNINDRIAYYRRFPLNGESRQALLQCQLHLADALARLLNSPSLADLLTQLQASEELAHAKLANQLHKVQLGLMPSAEKSQLHMAQASIFQGLRSQALDLTIVAPQCVLPAPDMSGSQALALSQSKASPDEPNAPNDFDRGIAAYLMQQADPDCRQAVWQGYQGRASERNSEALSRIYHLRQQQAHNLGFDDYALFALADEPLSTPALLKAFLDSQTQRLDLAPWDLGNQLAALPVPPSLSVTGMSLLEQTQQTLAPLGLTFEAVTEQITRVWHKGRLLGELFLNPGATNSLAVLRYPVIGQQFGQLELSFKSQQHSVRDLDSFMEAFARAMVTLGTGSHYYLSGNMIGTSNAEIATLWLKQFLQADLPNSMRQDDRLTLMNDYRTQLQVFRAKVALGQFQRRENLSYTDLGGEFYASFGVYWPKTNDYQYSFGQLASDGPAYYRPLWHKGLADLIGKTPSSPDAATIFDILVVNEMNHPLEDQLQAIIGAPVDPLSLIQRIQYATQNQNSANLTGSERHTGTPES